MLCALSLAWGFTRRGEIVGFFIPAAGESLPLEIKKDLFTTLTDEIRSAMKNRGLTEDAVLADFEKARKSSSSSLTRSLLHCWTAKRNGCSLNRDITEFAVADSVIEEVKRYLLKVAEKLGVSLDFLAYALDLLPLTICSQKSIAAL